MNYTYTTTTADSVLSWFEETLSSFNSILEDKNSAYACNFPPMNSYLDESTGELVLEFALAGYSPESLEIYLMEDQLKLSAKEVDPKKHEGKKILKSGIRSREFSVRYQIPAGKFDLTKATSSFKNGLLTIILPPAADKKPIKLNIQQS